MKGLVRYLLLGVITAVALIAIGVHAIHTVTELELKKSTYTETLFDFHIAAPSTAQVTLLSADEATEGVFPYYAYKKAFSKEKVALLLSDRMEAAALSVLTEGTLIEGEVREGGALLDKTAADALGVAVGDTVSFQLLGRRFTKTVSAIYLPSTLAILEDGVVLIGLEDGMLGEEMPAAYSGAFLASADKGTTAALLSDYAGEGNVALSYSQYVSLYCATKTPGQSDEEYRALCEEKYAAYREEILASAKRSGGQVVDKSEAFALIEEKLLTRERGLERLTLLTMTVSFLAFAAVLILFAVGNAQNDRILRDHGIRASHLFLGYLLRGSITAAAVTLTVLASLFAVAAGGYFFSECIATVLRLSLAVLAALVPALAGIAIYTGRLYRSSAIDRP